jgi:preprotein translocase subunit SecG
MINFFLWTTMIIFIIVCLFLILLVLIQKGRGGGLASAFGGAGGNTAFGSKTGDVLTWATSVVFGIFLVLAIVLNLLTNTAHNRRVNPLAGTTTITNPTPPTPHNHPPTTHTTKKTTTHP